MDGRPKGTAWGLDWALVPSTLPAREMTYQRIPVLRSAVGVTVPCFIPRDKNFNNYSGQYYGAVFIARSNF